METPIFDTGNHPWGLFVLLAFSVVLSALFSGSETALTSLSKVRTKQLIDSGGKWYKILNKWLETPEQLLTTILIGNTLVNIMGSVVAAKVALFYLGETAYTEAITVGGMTFLILVFGEIIPKTFAKYHARKICVPLLYYVTIFEKLFFPISWILSEISKGIIYLSQKGEKPPPLITEDDIEYLIEIAKKEKVFRKELLGEMLHSMIEFPDILVKEVMVPRTQVTAIEIHTPLDEVIKTVIRERHSRIPVYDREIDVIVGILFVKDLLFYLVERKEDGKNEKSLGDLIRKPPYFVAETQRIIDVLVEMQRRRTHIGVVVDEFGGTSGIITMEDILEEIVGEIRDELDYDELPPIQKTGENSWVVEAHVSIYDLGEELEVSFPDTGDYESLGGFLIAIYGSLPKPGTEIKWNGLKFKVVKGDEKRIQKVEIIKER